MLSFIQPQEQHYCSPFARGCGRQRPRYDADLMNALAEEQAARDAYAAAVSRRQQALHRQRQAQQAASRTPYFVVNPSPEEFYGRRPAFAYTSNEQIEDLVREERARRAHAQAERQRLQNAYEEERRRREMAGLNEFLNIFGRRAEEQVCDSECAVRDRPSDESSAPQETAPETQSTRIPVSEPTPSSTKPTIPPTPEAEAAAAKIQEAFRAFAGRRHALSSLSDIHSQFEALRASFAFPTTLDFITPSASEAVPALAYSHTNAPVHAYEDSLLKLLQALDAVESRGDGIIREARRNMVKEIEKELAGLDERKETLWKEIAKLTKPRDEIVEASSAPAPIDVDEVVESHTGAATTEAEPEPADIPIPSDPIDVDTTITDSSPSPSPSTALNEEFAASLVDSMSASITTATNNITSLPTPSVADHIAAASPHLKMESTPVAEQVPLPEDMEVDHVNPLHDEEDFHHVYATNKASVSTISLPVPSPDNTTTNSIVEPIARPTSAPPSPPTVSSRPLYVDEEPYDAGDADGRSDEEEVVDALQEAGADGDDEEMVIVDSSLPARADVDDNSDADAEVDEVLSASDILAPQSPSHSDEEFVFLS
ncbi:hypothetical protein BD410DRAFT_782991 [Rickenella mellea]|uniref:BAG domain-containing protein n=1 Tax=Rickenella mellea TaxID=50990 RepID=A0A4Y7QI17_9AGAM|nr:hypothetical protein BD410DRAFT_782991 [Rickenella mellea]